MGPSWREHVSQVQPACFVFLSGGMLGSMSERADWLRTSLGARLARLFRLPSCCTRTALAASQQSCHAVHRHVPPPCA